MKHVLKAWPVHFIAVSSAKKKVEIRKADRNYKVGDVLELREFYPTTGKFSGRVCFRWITHVYQIAGIHEEIGVTSNCSEGVCFLSLGMLPKGVRL